MKHCSSQWDRHIFLELNSNENGGANKLSFAFLVPAKENQKHAGYLPWHKQYKENEVSTNSKIRDFVSSCYVCNIYLYLSIAQLVETLRYKSKGRGFDSRWNHCYFSLTHFFRPHYGPMFDSFCNRNEYQGYLLGGKGGWCISLTTLPPSYAICLEILGDSTSWNAKGLSRPVMS